MFVGNLSKSLCSDIYKLQMLCIIYCTIPVTLEVTLLLYVGMSVYVTGQIIY